jgi:hypothetical protein
MAFLHRIIGRISPPFLRSKISQTHSGRDLIAAQKSVVGTSPMKSYSPSRMLRKSGECDFEFSLIPLRQAVYQHMSRNNVYLRNFAIRRHWCRGSTRLLLSHKRLIIMQFADPPLQFCKDKSFCCMQFKVVPHVREMNRTSLRRVNVAKEV